MANGSEVTGDGLPAAPVVRRRVDAGGVRLTGRDVRGLVWCGKMYGTRADLLTDLFGCSGEVLRQVHARWRRAGLAQTARLGPGPVWCWLTRAGLDACGLPYAAYRPPLGRLAHVHAVGSVRLALEQWPVYTAGGAYWRSERRLRWRLGPSAGRRGHVPDGEIHWPETSPEFTGQVWAIEVELTPKTADRTAGIMSQLLTRVTDYGDEDQVAPGGWRYTRVLYVTAQPARKVVDRARGLLAGPAAERVEVRELPAGVGV